MIEKILFAKEPDGVFRVRVSFKAVVPVVKTLTHDDQTMDGKYETMVGINSDNRPVLMRIHNVAAIDESFVKACERVVSEEGKEIDLDFETGAHVRSFLEAHASAIVDAYLDGQH